MPGANSNNAAIVHRTVTKRELAPVTFRHGSETPIFLRDA